MIASPLTRVRMVVALIGALALGASAAAQAPAFRIVVLAGEDAVNVIQQKTAVAPLVEVRDRNNNPVSGAVVTFAVQGGKAAVFQGGASTITIATNAAGQAAAAGFMPVTAGAVNISVSAAVQGQVVTAAITQVNVMTAAEAAAAASAAGGAGGAGGGAGGSTAGAAGGGAAGGGGLSATTIAIVGGAVAAGAVAATELVGEDSDIYKGSYSGTANTTFIPSLSFCTSTTGYDGTVNIDILFRDDGTVVDGVGTINGTMRFLSSSGGNICASASGAQPHGESAPTTGSKSNVTFSGSHPGNTGVTFNYEFTGAVNGDAITGTLILSLTDNRGTTRAVFPMTLQKQP